jgi:hypothetical protein
MVQSLFALCMRMFLALFVADVLFEGYFVNQTDCHCSRYVSRRTSKPVGFQCSVLLKCRRGRITS